MADTPIPVADLPKVTPGALDSVVGVDEATGAARRFGLSELPANASTTAAIAALDDRVDVIEAGQSAGMLGFATKADMDADLAHPAGTLALVTNDSTPANNGTYRKTGASGAGSWVLSADRVTGLEGRVSAVENRNTITTVAIASGNLAIDWSLGDYFSTLVSENLTTWSFSNLPAAGHGATLRLKLRQGGEAAVVTWPSNFNWQGSPPVLGAVAGSCLYVTLTTFDSGATWIASASAFDDFGFDLLFAGSIDGGWYGFPYRPGVGLFQERTGASATTPAMVGDPVGTVADKSGNGRYRTAPTDAARPILRQDGNGLYYLEYDATDDALKSAATYKLKMPQFLMAAYAKGQEASVTLGAVKDGTNHHRVITYSSGRSGINLQGASASVAAITGVVTANNATPVGSLVLVSSQAKSSYADMSVNGGMKISASSGWTTEEVTGAYIGSGALALNHEYGLIQATTQPSEAFRQTVHDYAGSLFSLNIVPSEFDIFILGGQSNMVGRADAIGDTHPAGCYQYNGTTVVPATVPLDHADDIAGDMGPDVSFAAAWMAANPGRNILFVPAAEGGTRFSNGGWRKGGTQYNRLVTRANAVIAAYPNATLRGVLMSLGENDTLAGPNAATYQTDMDQFIADIRADITGASSVPVVWGGMAPTWIAESSAARTPFQSVIEGIASRNTKTAYASSAGVASISGDTVHMDRSAQLTMGQRFFDALAAAEIDP